MCDVPVFYATTDGQTRRIAERIAADFQARGFHSAAIDVTSAEAASFEWTGVRGVLLGASLRAGRHQRAALAFAKKFRDQLNAWPSAFFSVSLSAASTNPDEVAVAERLAQLFPEQAGWRPTRVAYFAGRLAYTRYNWLIRLIMRRIARQEGASTDTGRDHEMTDWAAVARFATVMAEAIINDTHRRHVRRQTTRVVMDRPGAAA
jgi:menaquinone-dependent protoporphyrinogen oxidase